MSTACGFSLLTKSANAKVALTQFLRSSSASPAKCGHLGAAPQIFDLERPGRISGSARPVAKRLQIQWIRTFRLGKLPFLQVRFLELQAFSGSAIFHELWASAADPSIYSTEMESLLQSLFSCPGSFFFSSGGKPRSKASTSASSVQYPGGSE